MELQAKSIEDLPAIAQAIVEQIQHKVICFEGDMGAGKTTLIKEILKQLGSLDETSSPTFSIVNQYDTPKGSVYHFDMYRLKSEEEALDFGVEEYLYSNNLCLIEWPEKTPNLIPPHHHTVKINIENQIRSFIFV